MFSDFWNEIHILQRTWKCLLHFQQTQATTIGPSTVSILIWSRNCQKFDHNFDADEESYQEHALKLNNSQVMIQKPFPGLVAGTKYDHFIFFKNMGKLGLFWLEIECWLIIWPSIALKSNNLLDIFHNKPLLYTHQVH